MTYSRDMFPKLVDKFGPMIPTIEKERAAAAKITSFQQGCDRVTNVQITTRSTATNRRYIADCENRTRYFFDTDTIAAGYPAGMQTFDDMTSDGLEDW